MSIFWECLKSHLRIVKRHTYDPVRLWMQFPGTLFEAGATASSSCRFAEGVKVREGAVLHRTSMGKCSYVAMGAYLQNCTIGAFCSIGPWVRAGLGRHPTRDFVSTHPAFFSTAGQAQATFVTESKFDEMLPVRIGNDVWIGAGALIGDGVTIGDGAVVGGGAMVVKDVAPFTIVGGVPAVPIRKRFTDEQIEFLSKTRWWEKDETWLRRHAHLFHDIQAFMQAFDRTDNHPNASPHV